MNRLEKMINSSLELLSQLEITFFTPIKTPISKNDQVSHNEIGRPIKAILCEYVGKIADKYIAINKDSNTKFTVPYYYGIEKLKNIKIGDLISGVPHWRQHYLHPGTIYKNDY